MKRFSLIPLTLLCFMIFAARAEAAQIYPQKTLKFFVGQRNNAISNASGSFNFAIDIAEEKPCIGQSFIEFTGVAKNPVGTDIQLTLGDTSRTFSLSGNNNSSDFKILFYIDEALNNISNPGSFNYALNYTVSGNLISLIAAKCIITYQFFEPQSVGQTAFAPRSYLISSTYDGGEFPGYNTISWTTKNEPPNTNIRLQIATSDNINGPFDFAGPDDTAGSFYESPGDAISNIHNGQRYFRYKVSLSTKDPNQTPVVGDVKINFSNK